MAIKQTKEERCLLGVLVLPYVWGAGDWDMSGHTSKKFGYPDLIEQGSDAGFKFVDDFLGPEKRKQAYELMGIKGEYQYPALINSTTFFFQNWPSAEFKERLETDIRILKWMGGECVRIHLIPEEIAEYKGFLKWYLKLLKKYNIKNVSLDAIPWEAGAKFAAKYKDMITRLTVCNEWPSVYPPMSQKKPHGIKGFFEECCRLNNVTYDEVKKIAPDLPVGTNQGDWYEKRCVDEHTKLAEAFKENNFKFDFWGFDWYPNKHADVDVMVQEVKRMAKFWPDKEFVQAEFGFHQSSPNEFGDSAEDSPLLSNFSTSLFKDVAVSWGKQLDIIIKKSPIKEITVHYLHGKPVFHFECYHFCFASNGEPMPMGLTVREVYKKNLPNDATINKLDICIPNVIVKNEKEKIKAVLTNTSSGTLDGKIVLESPSLFKSYVKKEEISFDLRIGQKQEFIFSVDIPKELPAGVYHFFVKAVLKHEAEDDNIVYGLGLLHKLSARVDFDEKVCSQIPADTKIIYSNREKLKKFNFIGQNDEAPLIIYGKDHFNGGSQMQVACGIHLWEMLAFAIGQLPILERYDTFEEGMLETNPLILIGDAKENKWIKKLQESKKLSSIDIGKIKTDYEAEHIGTVEVVENAFNNRSAIVISGNDAFGLLWATQDFIESFFRNLRWPMKIFPPTKIEKLNE